MTPSANQLIQQVLGNDLWLLSCLPHCIFFSFLAGNLTFFLFFYHNSLLLTGIIETVELAFHHLPFSFAHQSSSDATFVPVVPWGQQNGSLNKSTCLPASVPELGLRGPTQRRRCPPSPHKHLSKSNKQNTITIAFHT